MSSRRVAVTRRGRRRARGENRAAMIAILMVVCLLFAVLFYEGWRLKGRISINELKRVELETAVEEEKARTAYIESRREFMQTDDFVRQAAKDRLGLVEGGEIIFKSRNS